MSILLLNFCLLTDGCTPSSLREAQETVRQAGSLWLQGQMYNDSLALAQAYKTLGHWQFFYADDYAHACYHYGKLLRAKENPVEAMQAFINATHSGTKDDHILGRVYSNMGSICHIATDYPLSYDMYECSANMFILNADTLNYYYALNDKAFELAEQKKNDEVISLTRTIEKDFPVPELLSKVEETKALLYYNTKQYKLALQCANNLQYSDFPTKLGISLKAKIFWYLGVVDSALIYAKQILDDPNAKEQHQYNMLYIVLNGDSTLRPEEIKKFSEQRADIEIKRLVPMHKRYAVAANLLHQELEKRPAVIYIVPIVVLIFFAIFIILFYYRRISKTKEEQQEILQTFNKVQKAHYQNKKQEIEQVCCAIRKVDNWQEKIGWEDYNQLCVTIDKYFYVFAHKLQETRVLNEKEIRLCILILIGGFSDKQLAEMLYYGEKSIRGVKRYTAQKLGTTSANIREFLINMLVGQSS